MVPRPEVENLKVRLSWHSVDHAAGSFEDEDQGPMRRLWRITLPLDLMPLAQTEVLLLAYSLLCSQVLLVIDHREEVSECTRSSTGLVLVASSSGRDREVGLLPHVRAVLLVVELSPLGIEWRSWVAGEHELAWLEKPNLTVLVQDVVESLVAQRLKDS